MFAIPVQQLNTSFFISFCFFTCIFIVWRRFECTYRQLSPYMFIPPLYLFPNPPLLSHFWKNLFGNIVPMKYGINTKIDSCGKIVSLCLEEVYKTTLQPLFISNTFISDTRLRFDLKNWQYDIHLFVSKEETNLFIFFTMKKHLLKRSIIKYFCCYGKLITVWILNLFQATSLFLCVFRGYRKDQWHETS